MNSFIECLITFSEDEHPQVSSAAKEVLSNIFDMKKDIKRESEELVSACYKNICALPRILRSVSEPEKLLSLHKVCGYLRLIGKLPGSRLEIFLRNSFERVSIALLSSMELEKNDISVLEKPVSLLGEGNNSEDDIDEDFGAKAQYNDSALFYEIRFAHVSSTECCDAILQIPRIIGCFSGESLPKIADKFMDVLRDLIDISLISYSNHKEIILFINNLVLGLLDSYEEFKIKKLSKPIISYIRLLAQEYVKISH